MSRMPRKEDNQIVSEVIGLVLLGLGTLLFLALISYTPRDVPSWFPIISSTATAKHATHNFIGPVGAILAGCIYFFLGAAAYLVAAVMLGYGGAKLIAPQVRLTRRSLWVIVFIISGACLADLQPMFLQDWKASMHIPGKGGFVGHWLGVKVIESLMGTVGSRILLVGLYVTSLVLMTGIHPILLVRQIVGAPGRCLAKYRAWQMERADEHERLSLQEKKLAREAQKIEKQLRKKKVEPATEPDLELAEDLVSRPAPQIIDTAVATPKSGKEKAKLQTREPVHFENYQMPQLDLLEELDIASRQAADPEELKEIQATLIDTLAQFGISVAPGDITRGPTITRYEVYPAKGVRVDKIVSLERDLARATRAERINILALFFFKHKAAFEIANLRKLKVTLRELLESEDWHTTKARIPLALGKDVYGKAIIADLAQMPHLLVAGTTGSGKSVCINSIIASMLYKFSPDELQLIMIDPKVVEMQVYSNLPHLRYP